MLFRLLIDIDSEDRFLSLLRKGKKSITKPENSRTIQNENNPCRLPEYLKQRATKSAVVTAERAQSIYSSVNLAFIFAMSRFQLEKHYGEWMLSRWYDNIPGPDRLVEISTSLSEEDAFNMVNAWSKKLLTPGLDPERLKSISESLITSHWNQACRMGCLAVQFTYINGFYHRFVWRVS